MGRKSYEGDFNLSCHSGKRRKEKRVIPHKGKNKWEFNFNFTLTPVTGHWARPGPNNLERGSPIIYLGKLGFCIPGSILLRREKMASSSSSRAQSPSYPSAARLADGQCYPQYTASLKCKLPSLFSFSIYICVCLCF